MEYRFQTLDVSVFHVNSYDFLYNDYFNFKYKPKTYLYFVTPHKSELEFKQAFLKFSRKTHHCHSYITQMD